MLNIGNAPVAAVRGHDAAEFLEGRHRRHGRADAAEPARLAAGRRGRWRQGQDQELHHAFPCRFAGPPRYLGHEAQCARRHPRRVQADQDERDRHSDLRAFSADGADDGQGGADPQSVLQQRGVARERPALDDDRPRFQREQSAAAHRLGHLARVRTQGRSAGVDRAAGQDRQHRHLDAARPSGRLPRQCARAVLPQWRSGRRRISRSPICYLPRG